LLASLRRVGLLDGKMEYIRLDAWLLALTANLPTSARLLAQQYWKWALKPTAEARTEPPIGEPLASYKNSLRVAAKFLLFLKNRNLTIQCICQLDIDAFVAAQPPSYDSELSRFVCWLQSGGMTRHPLKVRKHPRRPHEISRSSYLRLLKRLRTDATLPVSIRAGLWLLLISGRYLTEILSLHTTMIYKNKDGTTRVKFQKGQRWAVDPELGALLWQLRSQRGRWLFPSPQQKGRFMTTACFHNHLRRQGIEEKLPALRLAAVRELVGMCGAGEAAYYLGASQCSLRAWRDRFGLSPSEKHVLAQLGRARPQVALAGHR